MSFILIKDIPLFSIFCARMVKNNTHAHIFKSCEHNIFALKTTYHNSRDF